MIMVQPPLCSSFLLSSGLQPPPWSSLWPFLPSLHALPPVLGPAVALKLRNELKKSQQPLSSAPRWRTAVGSAQAPTVSKETYYSVKRDLLQCQRASASSYAISMTRHGRRSRPCKTSHKEHQLPLLPYTQKSTQISVRARLSQLSRGTRSVASLSSFI
jgi:hypothetical protein